MTLQIEDQFVTTGEAAALLGAKHVTVSQLCQWGRITAVKIANRWLIETWVVEDLSKTYRPLRGRPRTKRN